MDSITTRRGTLTAGDVFWTVTDGVPRQHTADRIVTRPRESVMDAPEARIVSGESYFHPDSVYLSRDQAMLEARVRLGNYVVYHETEAARRRAELASVDEMIRQAGLDLAG